MSDRGVPESRPGAEPADESAPEHARGKPIDEAQPSAPHRPELESADARTDKADAAIPSQQDE